MVRRAGWALEGSGVLEVGRAVGGCHSSAYKRRRSALGLNKCSRSKECGQRRLLALLVCARAALR